jgi:hypothetical protein
MNVDLSKFIQASPKWLLEALLISQSEDERHKEAKKLERKMQRPGKKLAGKRAKRALVWQAWAERSTEATASVSKEDDIRDSDRES